MTAAGLVAFASSEKGKLYARICDRYGVDPAAGEPDDVWAMNMRLVFMAAEANERSEPEPLAELEDDGTIHYEGGIR